MKNISVLCVAVLTLVIWTLGTPAWAAGEDLEKSSTPYEVATVFYKLAGEKPNFEDWIKTDSRYKAAENNQRAAMVMTEKVRLNRNYDELNLKTAYLKIRATVTTKVAKSKLGRPVLQVTFPGPKTEMIYFPYKVGEKDIALIPNGMDIYKEIPLTQDQATYLTANLNPSGRTTMVLEIVPVSSDNKKQMVLDGLPQWILLGEIGYIGFYNNLMENVWSLTAPGYQRRGKGAKQAQATTGAGLNQLKP